MHSTAAGGTDLQVRLSPWECYSLAVRLLGGALG